MWAMNLGAPPWSAATTTVTSLVAALARVGAILVTELATPGADDMTWEQILEMLDGYAERLASNF